VAGAGGALVAAGLLTKMLTAKPPAPAQTGSQPDPGRAPSPEALAAK
jgi:hypothetical protein